MANDWHNSYQNNTMKDQKILDYYLKKGEALRSKYPVLEDKITDGNTITWAGIAQQKIYGENPDKIRIIDTIIKIFDKTLDRLYFDEKFERNTNFIKIQLINTRINVLNYTLERFNSANELFILAKEEMFPNIADEMKILKKKLFFVSSLLHSEQPESSDTISGEVVWKQSRIAKAVYHLNLTNTKTAKQIADWVLSKIVVVLNSGARVNSKQLAKAITNVKTDELIRGYTFKLNNEMELIKSLLSSFPDELHT